MNADQLLISSKHQGGMYCGWAAWLWRQCIRSQRLEHLGRCMYHSGRKVRDLPPVSVGLGTGQGCYRSDCCCNITSNYFAMLLHHSNADYHEYWPSARQRTSQMKGTWFFGKCVSFWGFLAARLYELLADTIHLQYLDKVNSLWRQVSRRNHAHGDSEAQDSCANMQQTRRTKRCKKDTWDWWCTLFVLHSRDSLPEAVRPTGADCHCKASSKDTSTSSTSMSL